MKQTRLKTVLSLLLVLVMALTFGLAACTPTEDNPPQPGTTYNVIFNVNTDDNVTNEPDIQRVESGKTADGETLSPSGRLPDTYVRNFKNDPTWQNFGDNPYTNVADKNSSYVYSYVDYEESIYFGYRYYETRALDEDESWYSDNVVFPFGYGLSYTSFEQEIVNKSALAGSAITADGEIEITVRVTNTGDTYAAKDACRSTSIRRIPRAASKSRT